MNEIILKNEQAQFDALKKQSTDIAEQCLKLKVSDEVSKAVATQNLSKALGVVKDIEKIREEMKSPYFQAGKQIDAAAKALSAPIVAAIDEGKKSILAYDNEMRQIALKEQNRILAIKTAIATYSNQTIAAMDKCTTFDELKATRSQWIVNAPKDKWSEFLPDFDAAILNLNEYAKSRKVELLTPAESDPEEAEAIKEVVLAEIASVGLAEIKSVEVPKLAGSRKTWKHEVVDFAQIPRDMLILNEPLVKEFIKANSDIFTDGCIIKGIKYFQVESLTIR
jgi:hypothetical protein